MDESRYLDAEARREYLYERQYFPAGSITDPELERLERLNFHHFLGYARNYRKLVNQEYLPGPKSILDVFDIIDSEHGLAKLLFSGLRVAEWNLRTLTVKHFCQKFNPANSFLEESQYINQSGDSDARYLISSIVKSSLRYGEPFVERHIERAANSKGLKLKDVELTGKYFENRELLRDLELWSIIDSFSLGQLSKFILQSSPTTEGKDEVWRSVAQDLGINARVFHTNLKSLAILRNLVAHNVRLWMKPMPFSPKKPALFEKVLRNSSPKSMHVAFVNVAFFQPTVEMKRQFAAELELLLDEAPNYKFGITTLIDKNVKTAEEKR